MAHIYARWAIAAFVVIGSKSELLGESVTYSPPLTPPGADMKVSVTSTSRVGARSLSVSFTVPEDLPLEGNTYTKIYLYGYQMIAGRRTNDKAFPQIDGTWTPGSNKSFSFDLPETYFAKGGNWEVHFCVGDPTGCTASQNLLAGAP